ncbi:MAG: ATP-binding protein [Verrucomicrobiota bacterium]
MLALAGFGIIMSQSQEERLLKLSQKEAHTLAVNTAATLMEWVLNEDFDKLSEAALRTANFEEILELKVLDAEGYPYSSIERDSDGKRIESFDTTQETLPGSPEEYQQISDNSLTEWAPIQSDEILGWVKLSYSLDELVYMKRQIRNRGLIFSAIIASIAVTIFWRFLERPLKEIEEITEYSSKMDGESYQPLTLRHRTRETEKLAHTLNRTSKQLFQTLSKLSRAKEELEEKVQVRTRDLATTVSKLEEEMRERKKVEAQLLHAQKMESVGQLAAGVAHEINTPVHFVSENLQFIEESTSELIQCVSKIAGNISDNESLDTSQTLESIDRFLNELDIEFLATDMPEAIEESITGMKRVTHIVDAMKTFSHRTEAEKSMVNLEESIQTALTLSRSEWKYSAEVVERFESGMPPVPCYPNELNQVVINIVVNAGHAIEARYKNASTKQGRIEVHTHTEDSRWACLEIKDNGSGIPSEIADRVFDPFFTTKEVGKGTGQGLAISYDVIVNKHQGEITFESQEGKGSVFKIKLPYENT